MSKNKSYSENYKRMQKHKQKEKKMERKDYLQFNLMMAAKQLPNAVKLTETEFSTKEHEAIKSGELITVSSKKFILKMLGEWWKDELDKYNFTHMMVLSSGKCFIMNEEQST